MLGKVLNAVEVVTFDYPCESCCIVKQNNRLLAI